MREDWVEWAILGVIVALIVGLLALTTCRANVSGPAEKSEAAWLRVERTAVYNGVSLTVLCDTGNGNLLYARSDKSVAVVVGGCK